MDDPGVTIFRKTLFFVSRELTKEEVRHLKFLCKEQLTVKEGEDITDGLGLFEILERKRIISENDFVFLIHRMKDLQRIDLEKKLRDIMPGSSTYESTSPPTEHHEAGRSTGGNSGSSGQGVKIKLINSPFSLNNSKGNTYNYDSTIQAEDITIERSKAGSSATAINSPITMGDSIGNTYNYGGPKKSSSATPAAQRGGLRATSAGHGSARFQSSSSGPQGSRPASSPHSSTLKKPADFYPNPPKARPPEATKQSSSGSHASPRQEALPSTGSGSERPHPSASGSFAQTYETNSARVNKTSILDLPNIMSPGSSGPVSDNKCSLEKPSNSSPEGEIETDAPLIFNSKDDALLVVVGGENQMPVPTPGSDSAYVQDLKDVFFSQEVQGPGANADKNSKSPDTNESGMEVDADALEKGGQVVLRDYQDELAHDPLTTGGNYIICAPTGSGKTLTAASICYKNYTRYQKRSVPGRHFKALFIVNIRHLMQQQKNAFQEYFPDSLAIRTIAEQQPFEHALAKDEPLPVVLTLTAQIFVNALRQKAVSLQDLDMLVFDECHHTDLSHPYNVIMQTYLKEKAALPQGVGEHVGSLPQVIGLSASLGVGHGKMALNHLLKLCANMDVRDIKRVHTHKKQLDGFVKAPEQDVIISVHPRVTTERHFGSLLQEIMGQIEDQLGAMAKAALPSRGCQPYENRVVASQETAKHGDIMLYRYLNVYNRALMLYEDLPIRDCLQTLEEFYGSRSVYQNGESTQQEKLCQDLFDRNLQEMKKMAREEGDDSNPKLQELVKLLAKQFTRNPTSKGIILTRMKVATVALCEFIRSSQIIKDLTNPVQLERLVGQRAYEDFCMTESEQRMTLESFRQEDGCNVLVATDIAQEGLDMPACNFVIRYNFVSNEIGTVQSKGRARAEGSQCFLIVERGSFNEQREFENREKVKSMEKAMNELEAMPEEQRLKSIKTKQNEIINDMTEKERLNQQRIAQLKVEQISLICAECEKPVCKSSDLRRKGAGGYVTCVNTEIESRIIDVTFEKQAVRYRDTQSVCKIKCSKPQCKNLLGTRETFFLSERSLGFNLRAKSFMIQDEQGGKKKLKKWKELTIVEDEDL